MPPHGSEVIKVSNTSSMDKQGRGTAHVWSVPGAPSSRECRLGLCFSLMLLTNTAEGPTQA